MTDHVRWHPCQARGCEREACWPWYVCTEHLPLLALQQALERDGGPVEVDAGGRPAGLARKIVPARTRLSLV